MVLEIKNFVNGMISRPDTTEEIISKLEIRFIGIIPNQGQEVVQQ